MPCINSSGSWQCTSVGDIFWSDLRPLWTTLPLFKPRSLPMSNMCSCFSLCASCCRYFLTYSCSFSWFFPLVLLCLFLWEYFFLLDNGLQCNNIRLRSLFSSENSWLPWSWPLCWLEHWRFQLKSWEKNTENAEVDRRRNREMTAESIGESTSYKLHLAFLIMWKAQSLMNKVEKQHWQCRGNVR